MNNNEFDKALLDVSRLSMKTGTLIQVPTNTTLKEHPSLFLMTAMNQSTGKVESALVRSDQYEADSKFMKLMSAITGKEFKYVELPQVVDNYLYDILDKIKNDSGYLNTNDGRSQVVQGNEIRYQDIGAKQGSWKYLDSSVEFEVRYVKPMLLQEITDTNTQILAASVDGALDNLEELKLKLLDIKKECSLTVATTKDDEVEAEAVHDGVVNKKKTRAKSRKP